MSFPVGSILPEVILLAGSLAVLAFALVAPERRQQAAAAISLAVLLAAAAASLSMLGGGQGYTFSGTYSTDDAAVLAKLLVLGVTAVTVLLSVEWFRADPRRGEYYTLLLLSCLGAVVLSAATDLMELLLGVLLSSVTGYVLAGYHRRAREAGEAAMKYYLLGALTNAVLLYGAVLLLGVGGETTFGALGPQLAGADGLVLVSATGLVVVGLAFKAGAVPAHAWVPDVAEGAPAPVAAFLTAAPKVGALLAFARLAALLPESAGWRPTLAVVAAATMTLGNLACLWQDDVRRLLGWSAVSQTGYALMAVVALGRSDLAVPALVYFLAAYVVANVAAFGVVVELRGRTKLADYAGMAGAHPWLGAALVLAFLSFIGIPPLAGFAGKLVLFGAAIDAGYAWLAGVAVVNTVVSIFYYVRVLTPAYWARAAVPLPVLGTVSGAAVLASAAAVVVLGLVAEPVFAALADAGLLPG